jgi:hypothetical protein
MENMELSKGEWLAEDLLKKDTEEAYLCANLQCTVIPKNNHSLLEILSSKGFKIYRCVEEILKKKGPKSTFENYDFLNCGSGTWESDCDSPFYNRAHKSPILDTKNNKIVTGFLKGNVEPMRTSFIVLYTNTWCLTVSGSIYALETYSSNICDFLPE